MTKIQAMHKDIKWKANLQTHFKSHFQSYFFKNNFSTKSITITFHKAAVVLTLQQSPWRPDTSLIVQGGLWRLKSSQRQNQLGPGTKMPHQSQIPDSQWNADVSK